MRDPSKCRVKFFRHENYGVHVSEVTRERKRYGVFWEKCWIVWKSVYTDIVDEHCVQKKIRLSQKRLKHFIRFRTQKYDPARVWLLFRTKITRLPNRRYTLLNTKLTRPVSESKI